jgi:hypothetical protein
MSSTSSPTLIIDVRARRAEAAVAACTIAAGLLAPSLLNPFDATGAVVGGCLAGLLLGWGFRRAGWLGGDQRVANVSWAPDGTWVLTDRAGRRAEAVLESETRVTRRMLWLRWRGENAARGSRAILLTSADLPAQDLRRLIVRLRIDGLKRAPSPDLVAA